MAKIFNETIEIQKKGTSVITIAPKNIAAGAKDIENGKLLLRNKTEGKTTVSLAADGAILKLIHEKNAIQINAKKSLLSISNPGKFSIIVDASSGKFVIKDAKGSNAVTLNKQGNLILGGSKKQSDGTMSKGVAGEVKLFDGAGEERVKINARRPEIKLFDEDGKNKIHIDGKEGDIILHNADFAEDFDTLPNIDLEPGTVMTLNQNGAAIESTTVYDTKVIGVIAGAGQYRPGIIMDKQPELKNRKPISMLGKVECKADASNGPIQIGDLLTSSAIPGHAMRVNDPSKAIGAIIGKAMSNLNEGTGMVKMLICLQ